MCIGKNSIPLLNQIDCKSGIPRKKLRIDQINRHKNPAEMMCRNRERIMTANFENNYSTNKNQIQQIRRNGAILTLQGVDDVHGCDGLALGMLTVRDGITDDVLKEHLQNGWKLVMLINNHKLMVAVIYSTGVCSACF